MKVMEFTDENVHDVFQLLAAILHLGNVRFITAGGAQVENMNSEEYTQTPQAHPPGGSLAHKLATHPRPSTSKMNPK